ncbi:MAG: ribonuclease III [Gammaproteobacteria bacterium]
MTADVGSGIERAVGYRFRDQRLLEAALTHRSAGRGNNERMEFLGDALLGFVVADALFESHPAHDEGELTRMRARIVRRETLAVVARELDLGPAIRLGTGELRSGGWRRESILANALEAVIGAVYLDGGIESARAAVMRLFARPLAEITPGTIGKDPKTELQELLQARGLPRPEYATVHVEGEPHALCFTVSCSTIGLGLQAEIASGASRRRAEQAAARAVLDQIGSRA